LHGINGIKREHVRYPQCRKIEQHPLNRYHQEETYEKHFVLVE
jgi:hypothetical protein